MPPRLLQVAWGNYLKSLFVPGHMYMFESVPNKRYFLVGESKSFAGREAKAEEEAIGRPIAVSWFHKVSDSAQGDRCSWHFQPDLSLFAEMVFQVSLAVLSFCLCAPVGSEGANFSSS